MGVSGQHHAPAALYPRERTPGTHWIGGWLGLRAGLDAGARRKILFSCRGSNPERPTRSRVSVGGDQKPVQRQRRLSETGK
jgi:hypothetical protein